MNKVDWIFNDNNILIVTIWHFLSTGPTNKCFVFCIIQLSYFMRWVVIFWPWIFIFSVRFSTRYFFLQIPTAVYLNCIKMCSKAVENIHKIWLFIWFSISFPWFQLIRIYSGDDYYMIFRGLSHLSMWQLLNYQFFAAQLLHSHSEVCLLCRCKFSNVVTTTWQ